ncbi:hypothetical protein MUK42_20791 [Musa troglodytarum]|uniref:Uncharacterized protein n=1 Tax=Musa troglodytarum TaxID=320322 RepID=A0A9E7G3H7_9LILI|nr:hypothetical protein MUK42_20791 [Musa troglodytarum]
MPNGRLCHAPSRRVQANAPVAFSRPPQRSRGRTAPFPFRSYDPTIRSRARRQGVAACVFHMRITCIQILYSSILICSTYSVDGYPR